MLYAILTLTFVLTVLVLAQLINLFTLRQQGIEKRLKQILGKSSKAQVNNRAERRRGRPGQWLRAVSLPGSVVSKQYLDRVQLNLVRSGVPLKAQEFIGLSMISALALAAIGVLVLPTPILGVICGVLGIFVPTLWVNLIKQRRLKQLEGQLLDATVLLANSLRAGHSFGQALELVSRESNPPLSLEFARAIRETRLGTPIEEALTNLGQRVDSKDLELLITGVLIQRQVGGNLAEVLDSVAQTIEKRIKMMAKIRALTAQGRMSAWIVSLLPLALAAFVFGKYPEFARIMITDPVGLAMLLASVVLLVIGILLVRKVVSIDV